MKKIYSIMILIVLVGATAAAAIIKNTSEMKDRFSYEGDGTSFPLSMEQSIIWEDNFNDASKIDLYPPGVGKTENYIVENGEVSMINTCPAWDDPSWTRMKPITITNNAGHPLSSYLLFLTVDYDSDMKPNYDDIRFKHGNDPGTWLDYWIEQKDATSANIWIKIQSIPLEESMLYLFYGNSAASSESDFDSVFSWNAEWGDDERITYHTNQEGTWDPDVAYGDGEFLIAWEEGQAYYPPYTWGFKQEIRASIYDSDGSELVLDELVYKDSTYFYRNEDPSIAYGAGNFFVAWEHYDTVANPSYTTMDINARTVSRDGGNLQLGVVRDVCSASNCQADPNVEFDSLNNRFCVVWEDARSGTSNYNLWGRLYDTNGNPVGNEKQICNDVNCQSEPWIAFDPVNEQYMIVWEHGITGNNGPFSIKAGLFDEDLDQIGSTITIATGDDDTDFNFPCVEFCEETEHFLITYNDGDISDGDWRGNIWGKILDSSGDVVVDTFLIKSGNYVRTDIANYLSSSFLVSYDDFDGGFGKIWGKIVLPDGEIVTSDFQLSASGSAVADWANMGVGDGKIVIAWEDTRRNYPFPWDDMPDVYANMWDLDIPDGSEVLYSYEAEQELVLLAYITSIAIESENITVWDEFNAIFSGDIDFDILDGESGIILLSDVVSGQSIESISASSIRLMASFSRPNPSSSPSLDKWNVSWIPNHPPYPPVDPSPENGATDVDVDVDLSWTGGDPDPGDTVTYDVYFGTTVPPPQVAWNHTETIYDPGTLFYETTYFWQIVSWDSYGESSSGPVWSFTTLEEPNNPPYVPSNPDPPNHATDVDIDADLSWTGGDPDFGDVVTYDIYFGASSPPSQVAWNLTETTYDPGTMSHTITYYWQIVAWDNHGASADGPIWDFTTEYAPNNPPYVPSNPDPPNHATDVVIDADLSWTGGDPDPGDVVTYDVFFGTYSPPPVVAYNHTTTTYDLETLDYETTYFWQIIAWDNRGGSTPGPIWDFTTEELVNNPPFLPSDPDPPNHATDVDIDANLSWTGDDPDPGDVVTYDVYFGASSPPSQVAWNLTESTYEPGTMNYNTTYFWQIVAWDNHGASTAGSIWRFTTLVDTNSPPEKPTITGPPNGTVGVDYEFLVVGTDPNNDNISYFIDWGDDSTSGWIGPYLSGETVSIFHMWLEGGTFEIKVKAKDEYEKEGPWSDPIIINISEYDLHITIIVGLITNVSTEGEFIEFNAERILYIDLENITIKIYQSGEKIVASHDYLGGIIKGETSIIVGLFDATVESEEPPISSRPILRRILGRL